VTAHFVAVLYERQDGETVVAVSAPLDFDTAFALRREYEVTGHKVWMYEEEDRAEGEESDRGDPLPLGRP
jgi:hypothetical protein